MKPAALVFAILLACAATAQQKNLVESVQADRDVALDANPDSAFWREARLVYAEVDKDGRELAAYRTAVRSRWTKTSIYFLFVCPYERLYLKPTPDTAHETYELWKWNVAEVFIGSDFQHIKRYKEFEVSPQNEWIDLDVDLNHPHHEQGWVWNSGFEHAAEIEKSRHVWYAAMRIPFAALDSRPVRAGNTFRINFFRTEGAGPGAKEVMWRPVMGATFHAPERFGLLELR